MSFKLKTILLLVSLSLTPYIITMIILGNAYRNDFEKRLRDNMQRQLGVTVSQLDQQLQSLEKDLRFITSLDIMNDILTGDLDRRISDLLALKKKDLQLVGNIDVVDNARNIIASSELSRIDTPASANTFMDFEVFSTFDHNKIGELLLYYDPVNLSRSFDNDRHLQYSLMINGNGAASPGTHFENGLVVQHNLESRPEISVILEQDRGFAFSILDNIRHGFYVALAIGVLIIITIAVLVANYIVSPILLLSATSRSITNTQDYTQRVKVERSDEIGQLSSAFNLMIAGMQEMIDRLKEESENKLKLMQEKSRSEMLQNLSNKLSKYLSPQIYESIFSGEKDVALTSARKKLTIFFSDIVNFTGTTDQMESEDLTHLLNQYLNEMTSIALHHGATVDKYIGDAVMIFFGDPQTLGVEEDARKCVEMAIEMQKRVVALQGEWRAAGFSKPFSVRVGIHTGYCTVGNFGSENRMDYTIIGSAVNLTSRIESCAKPGTIYISEDTFLLVKDRFNCRPVDSVTPKGFTVPIQLYDVEYQDDQARVIAIDEGEFKLKYNPDRLSDNGRKSLKEILEDIVKQL